MIQAFFVWVLLVPMVAASPTPDPNIIWLNSKPRCFYNGEPADCDEAEPMVEPTPTPKVKNHAECRIDKTWSGYDVDCEWGVE
jgi:hypothetical protein